MAYQDDFRNKVLQALKAKNLAVDISQEATQQAIVEEAQNVANAEARPMSPEEMKLVLQDVANQLAAENQQFSAQSADFTAYYNPPPVGAPGNYPGGGFALSTGSKDIMIIPTAGTAGTVNTLSQIDFKYIYNPNTYGSLDATEVKSSIYNWAERISGQTFDTPVLGIGGAWGGVSYTPNAGYGTGTGTAGLGASIYTNTGRGNIIFLKPAISTINAALFNDLGLDSTPGSYYFTITGYNAASPNANPTAGFAVSFGGIGGSGPIGISGALSGTQYNQVRFLSPFTVSNATATDTITLGLSSATATTQFFVGGTGQVGNNYVLSTAASSYSLGDIFYATGTGHTNLTRLAIGANNTYLTSNGSVPSWTSSIAANTVAVNPTGTGLTILYPLLNNVAGSGAAISTDSDFSVDPGNNILRYSSGSFYVGTAVSTPIHTSLGDVAIRPGVNSTTGIQLENLAGQPILNVDTSNNRVSIGANVSAPNYTLDVSGYVNVATGSSYLINGLSVLSATSLGTGITNSFLTALGTVSTGVWSATAITAFYGGTGLQTYSVGDLLYADSTSTLARRAAVATGSVLASQGTNTAPAYVLSSTLSVGFATTASNHYIVANTTSADNYITFAPAVSSGTSGIGLSISNQSSQLTYNPGTQQLKVSFITGTAFTATNLTGTLLTAAQTNITSVGTLTGGTWQSTAIGTTYGGTGSNLSATGNTNKIIVLGTTANGNAATTIDGANSGYLLAANGNITAPSFVNSTAAAFTFSSGTLSINNAAITTGTITGIPTSANDIVNKSYADSISGGLDVHASARLTTLSAIGGSYRQAGVAGTRDGLGDYIIAATPATLIGSDSGWDTVGIALTNGQRVLVKDGVTGGYASGSGAYGAYPTTYGGFASSWVANGIYEVRSYGGAATSGWLLVRATDTDNQSGVQELTGGTFLFIEEGTFYADHAFVCSNDTTSLGPIGFGSTQIAWTLFAGGNTLIPGQGLVESGNNLALLFNLVQANSITAGSLSRGFSIGGTRAASLGSSSLVTFTVTGSADTVTATNSFTANTTGFTLSGGATSRSLVIDGTGTHTISVAADGFTQSGGSTNSRTLTVIGGNITVANGVFNGGGFGLTLSSSGNLNLNFQTLALSASMGNLTFNAGNTTPSASTQNIVQSGAAQYVLSTSDTNYLAGDIYYGAGTAYTALARLGFTAGTGNSVLIRGANAPAWGTIALGNSNFVSGILTTTNGGTGANLDTSIGRVVYTDGTKLAVTSVGTADQFLKSAGSGAPVWSAITLSNSTSVTGVLPLANGGTNNSVSGAGVSYQLAQYNSGGTAISTVALPTANNSVLIAATPISVAWSNGPLGMAYGGTNATTSNFTANGVVIYDSANTRLASATGLTMTGGTGLSVFGTVSATGGFFIAGNSVVTSFAGLYGAVTISSSSSTGGTSFLSTSGQNLVLNYPGTGITGSATAGQVAYFSAGSTLVGNAAMTFAPAGSGGSSFNLAPTSTSATALYIYSANTSGNILDATVAGSSRFSVDFKGLATHTAASGNTALVVSGGRTILSAPNTNYAQLNFGNTNANPGSGLSSVGDLWFNGTNLYFQTGATSKFDLLIGSVSGSGLADRIAKWSSGSGLSYSNLSESVAGVGMTLTATSAVGTGLGSTAYLTIKSLSGDEAAGIKNSSYFVRGIDSNNNRLFSVDVAGNLRATTKSFDIPHPTKDGMRLVYGVLEGPEHGVYHRGTVEGKGVIQVSLPDYWHKLVGDQYTIQLTPWGNYNVSIDAKTESYFTIQLVGDFISRKFKNIKVDYIVHGSRLDAPLDIEQ